MNYRSALLTGILVLGLPPGASAGTSTGNGGQSVVCQARSETSATPQSYDLYEGAALFGYSFRRWEGESALVIANRALGRLRPEEARLVADRFHDLLTLIDNADHVADEAIPLTADIAPIVMPEGCELRQTVVFRPDGKISLNSALWDALSPLSLAAFYLHEAVYWELRTSRGEVTAQRTRRIVSYLLSDEAEGSQVDLGVESRPLLCQDSRERFFFALNPQGKLGAGFSRPESAWNLASPGNGKIPDVAAFPRAGSLELVLGTMGDLSRAVRLDWESGTLAVHRAGGLALLPCAVRDSL